MSCEPIWPVTAAVSNKDQSTCLTQYSSYIDNYSVGTITSSRTHKWTMLNSETVSTLDPKLHFTSAPKTIFGPYNSQNGSGISTWMPVYAIFSSNEMEQCNDLIEGVMSNARKAHQVALESQQ